jgi:hypothetical protein
MTSSDPVRRRHQAAGQEHPGPARRTLLRALTIAPLAAWLSACGGGGGGADASAPQPSAAGSTTPALLPGASAGGGSTVAGGRAWRMGFGGLPPRLDVQTAIQNIASFAPHAELAAIHEEVPWTELLAGTDPQALLQRDKVGLVAYYRAMGLKVLFVAELNDGLAREAEAPQLRQLGRSLTEPAVQQVWRNYVLAVARLLQPDWMCLAAETNLVRLAASPALYGAVRQCANAAAADLAQAALPRPPVLLTSVQAEVAWGRLPGMDRRFLGVQTDLRDFPFIGCLGLSSYPYLGHAAPEDLPDDWYSRLLDGSDLPAMVVESGWSSVGAGNIQGSEDLQRRYLLRHAQLLDSVRAVGLVQLFFADLDLASMGAAAPANLAAFSRLGLTDSEFRPKAALATWDALRARALSFAG